MVYKSIHSVMVILSFSALFSGFALGAGPKRVMILVFDQTRADYIDRFDLKNLKRAQAMGIHFKNGIVGHLESNTVISHPVISTGRMPKNLPWPGHVLKDVNGIYGDKNKFYTPFALGSEGWMKGLKATAGEVADSYLRDNMTPDQLEELMRASFKVGMCC